MAPVHRTPEMYLMKIFSMACEQDWCSARDLSGEGLKIFSMGCEQEGCSVKDLLQNDNFSHNLLLKSIAFLQKQLP